MTYEEFKRELYLNIHFYEEVKDKNIRIFDQRNTFVDRESIALIKDMNFTRRGFKSILLKDDVLCAYWLENGEKIHCYWGMRDLYGRFLKCGWNEVIPGIIVKLQTHGEEQDYLYDNDLYERNRRRFLVRPVNWKSQADSLENCVYWTMGGNIALVLYYVFSEGADDMMMVKMNRDTVDRWGISDRDLLRDALFNTRRKMPPRLFHGKDLRYLYRNEEGIFMPDDGEMNISVNMYDKSEREDGYRLTTSYRNGGAVALFYPVVKERIAQLLGGDYYLGFIGVNEAIIYPVRNHLPADLRRKIRNANVRLDDRQTLSCAIFRYCSARRELLEV